MRTTLPRRRATGASRRREHGPYFTKISAGVLRRSDGVKEKKNRFMNALSNRLRPSESEPPCTLPLYSSFSVTHSFGALHSVLLKSHTQPSFTHGIRDPWCRRSLRRVPGRLRPGGRPRMQCPRLNPDACRRARVQGGTCLRKRVPRCRPPGREEVREKNDRD